MEYAEYLKLWANIMLHPGKNTKKELSVKNAFKMYYALAIIPVVLGLVLVYLEGGFNPFSATAGFASMHYALFETLNNYKVAIGAAFVLLLILVLEPVSMLANSALYHLIVCKLFRVYNKKYPAVFTAVMYGVLPALMVYWLYPAGYIGSLFMGIFGIWGLVVEIIALSNLLKISRLKALGTIILYALTVFVVAFVVAAIAAVA
jgi:hypothetical protein